LAQLGQLATEFRYSMIRIEGYKRVI